MKRKTRKILLVSSSVGDALEAQLVCGGWHAIWAPDAKTAIARARRERFDLAVLISTGQEMDITETFFNLRDIRPALPIAIVQPTSDFDDTRSSAAYLPTDNNLIAVQDLDDLVRLLQPQDSSVVSQPSRDRPQS